MTPLPGSKTMLTVKVKCGTKKTEGRILFGPNITWAQKVKPVWKCLKHAFYLTTSRGQTNSDCIEVCEKTTPLIR